ncbi:DUF1000-domain-containing protein [Neolentinus lepideus HHB14362 ss-1]|uniref:DUF1000-domain-containing protein n=1 Tax=Neolentinus lepideus HHB14362 ss-1 TaxID=1314782 RepID=A0A165V833_9AGAM|nr:DUF1000-domain-containing protein [Neolentinus lepideus HHB14362 ss-1]
MQVSLLEFVNNSQTTCLNESFEHGIKSILSSKKKNTSDAYLLSDADEQLLLNISFNQTVRVRSIVIKSTNASQAPQEIKILVNRSSVGFEDVQDAKEPEIAQALNLTEEQVTEGQQIPLRFVRFQTVNSIHIFVASNHGGEDETRIDAVDILGVPVETTKDLSGLKKQDE